MSMTAKASAQIVASLFGALMAYGVFDMNAQNIAHDQQGATQPQGGERATSRGGPKQKDKALTGRTVVGGPPIVPTLADCAPAPAPTPAPAAILQSSSGGAPGPKGDGESGRTSIDNAGDSTAQGRHRGGPRGGGRDKIDTGRTRAAPGGPAVVVPQAACPPVETDTAAPRR